MMPDLSLRFPVSGPSDSRICIVGEAPYGNELTTRRPFSSTASRRLSDMLWDNRADINHCLSLYVWGNTIEDAKRHYTTKKKEGEQKGFVFIDGYWVSKELKEAREAVRGFIKQHNFTVVLLAGDLALWAVTGLTSSYVHRGSILNVELGDEKTVKAVVTVSQVQLNNDPKIRPAFSVDIARLVKESKSPCINYPPWDFVLHAGFDWYIKFFANLKHRLDAGEVVKIVLDIETIQHEIACIGFALSKTQAVCVPIHTSKGYWNTEQELALVMAMRPVLEHKNARCCGQNINYDAQYISLKWGIVPRVTFDTMVAYHILYTGQKKSLDYIASMKCEYYRYWKDELDDYKKAPKDDGKFFSYNLQDCVYTFECWEKLETEFINEPVLHKCFQDRIQHSWYNVLIMELRGIAVNQRERYSLLTQMQDATRQRQEFLNYVIGYPFNANSTVDMRRFFIEEMGIRPRANRQKRQNSLDAETLLKISETNPLLSPIIEVIVEMRAIKTLLGTFIQAKTDCDNRMRSQFGIAHTTTFRFNSSENAHGTGANLQNIPDGKKAKTAFRMPNVRKLYVPDPGYEIFDIDLAGADAQVVAWEADDKPLKDLFRSGLKVHAENAKDLFGGDAGPDGKREPYYFRTKMGVHLTNYGGWPKTMASALSITVHEAEKFQKRWFEIHPSIAEWHRRVQHLLQTTRTIENKFGYRITFHDRLDFLLPTALAWCPQSTVAIVADKAQGILEENFPIARINLQVHDSLVFQLPINRPANLVDEITEQLRIPIPYDDVLIIPFGVKSSVYSWGDCK